MKQTPTSQKLPQFLGFGIALVFFVIALIFLSYVFIIGAAIGLALFVIAWIRSLFAKKSNTPYTNNTEQRIGNVYDHDEFK